MNNKVSVSPGEMLAPLPAVMVSVGNMDNSNIITVAWTGIVNSDPPYTYISVRKSRFSHLIIESTGEFVINLTTEKTAKAADFCGVKSGRDVDKFKEAGLTKMAAEVVSCPIIAECPVNLECQVIERLEFPSHDMFIAEIVNVNVSEELFDDKGRIELDKAGLLAYAHGEYFGLKKEPLGFFGFSVAKPKALKKKSKAAHDKRVSANKAKRVSADKAELAASDKVKRISPDKTKRVTRDKAKREKK